MSPLVTTRTGWAKVNEAQLYFEVAGEGFPLVLLHAGVADSRMWDPQMAALAEQYRVVRFDLRGFGRTMVPPAQFSHHDDVAALLNFLEIEPVYLIGASFGGAVALDFSLAYPGRVKALVLSAPALGGYEPTSLDMQRFLAKEEAALDRGDVAAATELNLRMWVDGLYRSPADVDPALREQVREMQLQAFSLPIPEGAEDVALKPPAVERLAEIHAPTLVIAGEQDVPEFLKISEIIARGITGAKKVIIPGVAHLPGLEKPEIFNQLILNFLKGLDDGQAGQI